MIFGAKEGQTLEQQMLQQFKKKLQVEKKRLEEELIEIEEGNLTESQSEMTGENSYEDHFADSGTATFEREKDLSLERNIKDLLSRVNAALQSIEQGTFGLCQRCGKEIGSDRLDALPYANLCIDCKKKEEESW
jgi:RNA polymerase-binding protein DksA